LKDKKCKVVAEKVAICTLGREKGDKYNGVFGGGLVGMSLRYRMNVSWTNRC